MLTNPHHSFDLLVSHTVRIEWLGIVLRFSFSSAVVFSLKTFEKTTNGLRDRPLVPHTP